MIGRSRHQREGHNSLDVARLVDGELDVEERTRVSAQVRDCWECQDLVRILESAGTRMRYLTHIEERVPPNLRSQLLNDLDSQSHVRLTVRRSFTGVPGIVGTVAAALLLLIGSSHLSWWSPNNDSGSQHTIAAPPLDRPYNSMQYQPMLVEPQPRRHVLAAATKPSSADSVDNGTTDDMNHSTPL